MFIPGIKKEIDTKTVFLNLILLGIYIIAGKLSLRLAFFHPSATPIWIPTGISIAAFVIYGKKILPAIFLGAFYTNATTAGTLLTSLGIAAGNTFEGWVGATFINRFLGRDAFFKPMNIFKYFLIIGLLTTLFSAAIGTSTLYLGDFVQKENFRNTLITWWLGNMGGAILITPFILLWTKRYKFGWKLQRFIEFLICLAAITAINYLLFSGKIQNTSVQSLAGYFSFPFMVWVAFRFGPRETITVILAIFTVLTMGLLKTFKLTANLDTNALLLSVQVYMAIIFMTIMPLAATIYEQRRIKNLLRERSERYRKLIETSPSGIIVSDLAGKIKVLNKKSVEMYGHKNKMGLVGKSIFKLIAKESLPTARNMLSTVLKRGRADNIEVTGIKRNKKSFYISANASLLFDSEGRPDGVIVTSQDITHKKEIDKLKSDFISLASHQLRTPLTSMRWLMEMLLGGDFGKIQPKKKAVIKDLHTSLLRLVRIVNDLLNISRLEEGRGTDVPQQVHINELLESTIADLSQFAKNKNIKVTIIRKPKSKMTVTIDHNKLNDVFENLISNSIKYNKPGGKVDLVVSSHPKIIKVEFRDNGHGIADGDKEKIFTKFFRSVRAAQSETEGTGLGLYLVKTYIENWGGKIYFTSKLGIGTKFIIEIPKKPKLNIGSKK